MPDFAAAVTRMRAARRAGEAGSVVELVDIVRSLLPRRTGARYIPLAAQLVELGAPSSFRLTQPREANQRIGDLLDEVRGGDAPEFALLILKWLWTHHPAKADALIRPDDRLILYFTPEKKGFLRACAIGFAEQLGINEHLVGTIRLRFQTKEGRLVEEGDYRSRFTLADGREIKPDHRMFEAAVEYAYQTGLPQYELVWIGPSRRSLDLARRSPWIDLDEADIEVAMARRPETLSDEKLVALLRDLHTYGDATALWSTQGKAAVIADRLIDKERNDLLLLFLEGRPRFIDFPLSLRDPESDEVHLLLNYIFKSHGAWLRSDGAWMIDAALKMGTRLAPEMLARFEKERMAATQKR